MKRFVPALGLVLALGLLLLSAGAAFASGDAEHGDRVFGSGRIQSEDRDVPEFDAIVVDGSGNVTFRQSASQLVSVETDDNILPLVRTEVVDGVLHVGLVRGARVMHMSRLEFTVASPRITGFTISGSGNARTASPVRAQGLRLEIRGSGSISCDADASALEAVINGSGGITARGHADRVTVAIGGSGSVRAHEMESAQASVRIDGSGDAMVYATDTLDVSINGSGSVRYGGSARATVHTAGSGSLQHL